MNTLTDLLLGVGQPRVSHFPDLCTLLYTYLSTLDYWTKIVYYLFTQTSPVAHTSALTPTYIKSQKLPNWPISKELGLGRMLLPHWKLLLNMMTCINKLYLFSECDPCGFPWATITVHGEGATRHVATTTPRREDTWHRYGRDIIRAFSHWGRDKMDAISQTTVSIAFSWMKMLEWRLNFHGSLFLRGQLTIFQHWFR